MAPNSNWRRLIRTTSCFTIRIENFPVRFTHETICQSFDSTKEMKVFFLGFQEDIIYLFQDKFLFRILYLFTLVILVVLYLADINYMAYPMLDFQVKWPLYAQLLFCWLKSISFVADNMFAPFLLIVAHLSDGKCWNIKLQNLNFDSGQLWTRPYNFNKNYKLITSAKQLIWFEKGWSRSFYLK